MDNRRSTYFIFQALVTVVLLLFFFYRNEFVMQWSFRLVFLGLGMGFLLVFLAVAPLPWLLSQRVQAVWFISDVVLSSLTLYWAHQPESDLYLTYFLIIFGTALTENVVHSFMVALVATILYGYSALRNTSGIPTNPEFWLRLPYLWIFASFTALLTSDSRESRKNQEAGYRERLFHMERLAALGQISAEVAHQIKAPLTTIKVNAEVLGHQPGLSPMMSKELLQIEHEVDHCKNILQKLLELGRIEEMDIQPMELRDALRSALETIRPQLGGDRIQLRASGLEQSAPLQGDPILISEAIIAVLQNAVDAMPEGGVLQVSLDIARQRPWWRRSSGKNTTYEVNIQDTGEGISPKNLEAIFRPFFTTKKGHGSGLGLSAGLRILDKHGGTIKVSSPGLGGGARFTLTFPKG